MSDDIGLGLSSMAVCFDFCSTNVVQLSKWNLYFYSFPCHHPSITKLSCDMLDKPKTNRRIDKRMPYTKLLCEIAPN